MSSKLVGVGDNRSRGVIETGEIEEGPSGPFASPRSPEMSSGSLRSSEIRPTILSPATLQQRLKESGAKQAEAIDTSPPSFVNPDALISPDAHLTGLKDLREFVSSIKKNTILQNATLKASLIKLHKFRSATRNDFTENVADLISGKLKFPRNNILTDAVKNSILEITQVQNAEYCALEDKRFGEIIGSKDMFRTNSIKLDHMKHHLELERNNYEKQSGFQSLPQDRKVTISNKISNYQYIIEHYRMESMRGYAICCAQEEGKSHEDIIKSFGEDSRTIFLKQGDIKKYYDLTITSFEAINNLKMKRRDAASSDKPETAESVNGHADGIKRLAFDKGDVELYAACAMDIEDSAEAIMDALPNSGALDVDRSDVGVNRLDTLKQEGADLPNVTPKTASVPISPEAETVLSRSKTKRENTKARLARRKEAASQQGEPANTGETDKSAAVLPTRKSPAAAGEREETVLPVPAAPPENVLASSTPLPPGAGETAGIENRTDWTIVESRPKSSVVKYFADQRSRFEGKTSSVARGMTAEADAALSYGFREIASQRGSRLRSGAARACDTASGLFSRMPYQWLARS